MLSPQRYHEREHEPGPFEGCWRCGRAKAKCQRKIRFTTWADADEWITEFHESKDYALPWATRYRCRWCDAWHMTSIRDRDRTARDRVEKQRRRWLAAREVTRRSSLEQRLQELADSFEEQVTERDLDEFTARVFGRLGLPAPEGRSPDTEPSPESPSHR